MASAASGIAARKQLNLATLEIPEGSSQGYGAPLSAPLAADSQRNPYLFQYYTGQSGGVWSPQKHGSQSPSSAALVLDYSATAAVKDEPSAVDTSHFFVGMPHSAPTTMTTAPMSSEFAAATTTTTAAAAVTGGVLAQNPYKFGLPQFGGVAVGSSQPQLVAPSRMYGQSAEFAAGGSGKAMPAPSEVVSVTTDTSKLPTIPQMPQFSIQPIQQMAFSFPTQIQFPVKDEHFSPPHSGTGVRQDLNPLPLVEYSTASGVPQPVATLPYAPGQAMIAFQQPLITYDTGTGEPLHKRPKYEVGATTATFPLQYSTAAMPSMYFEQPPHAVGSGVTLAGRPRTYQTAISFPTFGGSGALVPPGLSSSGGYRSTHVPSKGRTRMPPDVVSSYSRHTTAAKRKRSKRKLGSSARSMDREELAFVRYLFEDTDNLRNTEDLSSGDATAGPNAKGFQRGGRRTTKSDAVTVTHFGTKPPGEHPAYARIRVWKDERGRQFYDCVCNARKPVQDLNKIKKHALSHDQGRFMCDICGKVFGKNHLQLNAHKKTHKTKRSRAAMQSTTYTPSAAASSSSSSFTTASASTPPTANALPPAAATEVFPPPMPPSF